jgi:hypothetical protein
VKKFSKFLPMLAFAVFGTFAEAEAKPIVIELDDEAQKVVDAFKGITISGDATMIYQSSSLDLREGDLKDSNGNNLSKSELNNYDHPDGSGTFSANLRIEKQFNENELFHVNLQFANGLGVDQKLQGGAMVNNDVMEDADNHNQVYIAKAFYERTIDLPKNYKITFDLGKFGVNDFFDVGDENSDQTTQFLNQAIANNGAFDYVQDLQGHGYTYGSRIGIANDLIGFDFGFFSSDSYMENITKKYSLVGAITLTPTFGDLAGKYQFYVFSNRGEYAAFDSEGNLVSKDADVGTDDSKINSKDNLDNLTKNGFGVSITQALSDKINLFGKFGKQDDDRDVRHYQDMDESYMLGANFSGKFWGFEDDKIGVAYQIGRLTGNHRKAHEKGYVSFFDRSGGIGAGNYADEKVLEVYYNHALTKNTNVSLDVQHISNFYYSKVIGDVQIYGVRFNTSF